MNETRHRQIQHRSGFRQLGVIGPPAISVVSPALWDIEGKDLGVPCRPPGGRAMRVAGHSRITFTTQHRR